MQHSTMGLLKGTHGDDFRRGRIYSALPPALLLPMPSLEVISKVASLARVTSPRYFSNASIGADLQCDKCR